MNRESIVAWLQAVEPRATAPEAPPDSCFSDCRSWVLAGAGERVTTGRQLNPKNYGIPNATV